MKGKVRGKPHGEDVEFEIKSGITYTHRNASSCFMPLIVAKEGDEPKEGVGRHVSMSKQMLLSTNRQNAIFLISKL